MKKLICVCVVVVATISGLVEYKAMAGDFIKDEGVVITCNTKCGKCWIRSASGYCVWTGYQLDYCC